MIFASNTGSTYLSLASFSSSVCMNSAWKATFNLKGNPWFEFRAIYLFDRDVGLSIKALKVLLYVIPHGLYVYKLHGLELGGIFCCVTLRYIPIGLVVLVNIIGASVWGCTPLHQCLQ